MSKVKVALNLAGVNQLMKSPEIQAHLQTAGALVAAQATAASGGAAFDASTHLASFVAITNVYPASKEAAHDNFENNTLLKSIGATGLYTSKTAAKSEGKL